MRAPPHSAVRPVPLTHPAPRCAAEERSASVTLVYECDGAETKFTRGIKKDGVGEYRIDGKACKWEAYSARLKSLGVLTQALTGFLPALASLLTSLPPSLHLPPTTSLPPPRSPPWQAHTGFLVFQVRPPPHPQSPHPKARPPGGPPASSAPPLPRRPHPPRSRFLLIAGPVLTLALIPSPTPPHRTTHTGLRGGAGLQVARRPDEALRGGVGQRRAQARVRTARGGEEAGGGGSGLQPPEEEGPHRREEQHEGASPPPA